MPELIMRNFQIEKSVWKDLKRLAREKHHLPAGFFVGKIATEYMEVQKITEKKEGEL